ncbi:MAG: hypothetical protein ACRCWF_05580 [Beijerinckiaceae bacterium]
MNIDLRLLIVPVAPFVFLGMSRAVWWVAGAEWSEPEFAAFLALLTGSMIGGIITAILFNEGVHLGHLHIGTDGIRIIPPEDRQ